MTFIVVFLGLILLFVAVVAALDARGQRELRRKAGKS
jgi:hypothetical protein